MDFGERSRSRGRRLGLKGRRFKSCQPTRRPTVHFPLVGVVSVVADLGADQIVETATVVVQVPGRTLIRRATDATMTAR